MKKVAIALFCLSLSTFAATAQDKSTKVSTTEEKGTGGTFKFKDKDNTHNYGDVEEGPTAEYDFEFKNNGTLPITISEAHGSCGCTVPKWPKEPIPPKGKGVIHVTYNTAGRPGPINKEVTITYNDGTTGGAKTEMLHIRGNVKGKAGAPVPPPPPLPAPHEPNSPAPPPPPPMPNH